MNYTYSILLLFSICSPFAFIQAFEVTLDDVFSEILLQIPGLEIAQNPMSSDDLDAIKEKKERMNKLSPYAQMVEDMEDPPRVEVVPFGTARGRKMKSFSGRNIFAFQSIPYADPPIDDLRFKTTQKYSGTWPKNEDFDASYLRPKCPQPSMFVGMPGGREDCLHLSIYTPVTMSSETNYPVMFFIHGGSYYSGDASLYVPTKLLDEDVVVVVIQYRLGSLGFLSSGTIDAPGNMGLMDQIVALRWVKDYIQNFGGNPKMITVFGQSAGGASASWMQMTPQTTAAMNDGEDLFQQLITMSGSAIEMWTLDPDPEASFIDQAQHANCYTADNDTASLECMRELTAVEIVDAFYGLINDSRYAGGLGFFGNCPIIQDSPDLQDYPEVIVIAEHPLRTVHKNEFLNVNVMAGSVRDEGSLVLGLVYTEFLDKHGLQYDEYFLEVESMPYFVNSFGIVDMTGAVANAMDMNYLKNADTSNFTDMSGGLVDMTGMLFLKTGLWSLSHLMNISNPDNPIYFYSFEFDSDDSFFDWFFMGYLYPDTNFTIEGGITHGDELLYLFYLPSMQDEKERNMSNRFTTLWTNFAKYGNPTPDNDENWKSFSEKWIPFTVDTLDFMLIDDNITMEQDFTKRWNYNTIPDPVAKMDMRSMNAVAMGSASVEGSKQNGFKIATGILATIAACLCMLSIFLLYKK